MNPDAEIPASLRQQARNKWIAVSISVLLHLLALWLIVRHQPDLPLPRLGNGDTVTTLLTLPDSASRPAAVPSAPVAVPSTRAPARKAVPRRRDIPPRDTDRQANAKVMPVEPPLIALDKSLPAAQPLQQDENRQEDDFSARLAARQRERAAAENQERAQQEARGSPEQQANERGKQVALANIASQLRAAGLEKDDAGGLFQLQHVGSHHAAFLFRGWKKEARRNWSQQLDVEQGTESDIRIAVVKKMIEIIRQHTQADFTWDSRRLGKQIHLSARTEDAVGLQQFLLREFFPDFSAASQ